MCIIEAVFMMGFCKQYVSTECHAQWLALLLHILKVAGLNHLFPEISCPDGMVSSFSSVPPCRFLDITL